MLPSSAKYEAQHKVLYELQNNWLAGMPVHIDV